MSRRRYTRRVGQRRYRRIFVISTEGTNTEPQYFRMFNGENATVHVKMIKNRGSAPWAVLAEMKRYLRDAELRAGDSAWLVVDRDRWTEEQLRVLHEWAQTDDRFGLAVSNPMFEYWILLHFEDGNGVGSSKECNARLRRHLPEYDKNVQPRTLRHLVPDAISRAERRDSPPCAAWPRTTGTTVYRLVREITGID